MPTGAQGLFSQREFSFQCLETPAPVKLGWSSMAFKTKHLRKRGKCQLSQVHQLIDSKHEDHQHPAEMTTVTDCQHKSQSKAQHFEKSTFMFRAFTTICDLLKSPAFPKTPPASQWAGRQIMKEVILRVSLICTAFTTQAQVALWTFKYIFPCFMTLQYRHFCGLAAIKSPKQRVQLKHKKCWLSYNSAHREGFYKYDG